MDNLEQITALATLAGLATTITGFYFGKFMERRSNHNERMELIHSQLNGETDVGNLDIYQHDPKSDRYSHQGKFRRVSVIETQDHILSPEERKNPDNYLQLFGRVQNTAERLNADAVYFKRIHADPASLIIQIEYLKREFTTGDVINLF